VIKITVVFIPSEDYWGTGCAIGLTLTQALLGVIQCICPKNLFEKLILRGCSPRKINFSNLFSNRFLGSVKKERKVVFL
jgi:hypothetical protein